MSEPQFSIPETAQLRDKIDWPYWVNIAGITVFNILKDKDNYPAETVQNTILFMEQLIPSAFRNADPEYKKLMISLDETRDVDIRPEFGGVKASLETCKKLGIPISKKEKIVKPVERFGAIIDLLNRLNVLTKMEYTEFFTGEKWDELKHGPKPNEPTI